jgi:hypothetical protein
MSASDRRRRAVRLRPGRSARDWPLAAGLIAGASADAILGDPQRGHPVALFGRLMTALEQHLYADRAASGIGLNLPCQQGRGRGREGVAS